jgi:triphosphoribosyl-dephospho-CoA synthetase
MRNIMKQAFEGCCLESVSSIESGNVDRGNSREGIESRSIFGNVYAL